MPGLPCTKEVGGDIQREEMNAKCVICEKLVIEHPFMKNVFYCNNQRCPRLGTLSVFVLEEKPKEEPEKEKKDSKDKVDDPSGGE